MNAIGLGNALVDVLVKLKNDDVLADLGIKKGTMTMIDHDQMLALHQSLNGLERTLKPGGSLCNTTRALANLGMESGFVGRIGTDSIGESYRQALLDAGVIPYFQQTKGISGCCTSMISMDGERTMCTFLGPAPDVDPDAISDEILSSYQYINVEGYLLVNEHLIRRVMQKAKACGLKVALGLADFNIVKAFHELLDEIIPAYVDVLFANEIEAETYTGLPVCEAALLLAEKVDVVVVTLGEKGAMVCHNGEITTVSTTPCIPVDTTGAGDYFAAGFLYGLSVGASLKQSATIGTMLGSYIIKLVGAEIPDENWEQIKLKVREILS